MGGIKTKPTIIRIVEGIKVKPRILPNNNNIPYAQIGGLSSRPVISDFTSGALNI